MKSPGSPAEFAPNETCHLLALDFDKQSWQEDVKAFAETCEAEGIPAGIERSRSGNGAHVWIFFEQPISASKARKLGSFLMTRTLDRRPEIGLDSFDRFFPNQDTLPKGGFGNLISLPLQKAARAGKVQGEDLLRVVVQELPGETCGVQAVFAAKAGDPRGDAYPRAGQGDAAAGLEDQGKELVNFTV